MSKRRYAGVFAGLGAIDLLLIFGIGWMISKVTGGDGRSELKAPELPGVAPSFGTIPPLAVFQEVSAPAVTYSEPGQYERALADIRRLTTVESVSAVTTPETLTAWQSSLYEAQVAVVGSAGFEAMTRRAAEIYRSQGVEAARTYVLSQGFYPSWDFEAIARMWGI
jgi:hypothetical protein